GKVGTGFPSGIAWVRDQFQEKWVPVFRPELYGLGINSRKRGYRFSVRNCMGRRSIPGKVGTGFPSGIAPVSDQFQDKWVPVFRPELHGLVINSRKSGYRFSVRNCMG